MEKLTESEELVMKAVWDCKKEPVVSDVLHQLIDVYGKDWKQQTVSTFLAKLVRKNYIKLHRNGKIYTYEILVSEEEYNYSQMQLMYSYLYKNNKEKFRKDVEHLFA